MTKSDPTYVDYRLKIDAYTPDTMPMARLAEYMTELAVMLGEERSVHFRRLERGSTVLVQRVEREAVPKVRERLASVRRQDAPPEAAKACAMLNRLLKEDNGVGTLKEGRGVVLRFPGRELVEERYPTIRQPGTLDGTVVSVGGADATVHVRLLVEGKQVSGCFTTNRMLAKDLAQRFDEPVRLTGIGSWIRDADGKWALTSFKIDGFEALKPVSLSEALDDLRALRLRFDEGAYDELTVIRHGPQSKTHGGH